MSTTMRRNIGSRITSTAARRASQTASGMSNATGLRTVSSRGSSAGLKNERAVRLEHNSGGYLNPRNQIARLGVKSPIVNRAPLVPRTAFPRKVSGNILDTRMTRYTDSSASLLNKRM